MIKHALFPVIMIVSCFCVNLVTCGDDSEKDAANGPAKISAEKSETVPFNTTYPANKNSTKNWQIEITKNIAISVRKDNDVIALQIGKPTNDVESRKKKVQLMDVIPYLIIPGFISAGVLPWLIPGMKMAVMGVAMINQMAFTSGLFTLIRGYIFDTSQEDHIVYVNHGYEKYKHQDHPHSYRHR